MSEVNFSYGAHDRANWGRWGADDERGAANHVADPATVARALSSAVDGRVHSLGIPIQRSGVPTAGYRSPSQRLTSLSQTDRRFRDAFGVEAEVAWNEDLLVMATHGQTHVDALCHVTDEGVLYNGFSGDEVSSFDGAPRCGIEKLGPIVSRGVLLDVARAKGVPMLDPGYAITSDDLIECLTIAEVDIVPGDAVLIRTGWLETYFEKGLIVEDPQPGLGLDGARYLADRDVVLVGADNTSMETYPFDQGRTLGVHRLLLVHHGIPIAEHLWLKDLAATGRATFLFVASPLSITGATASPANPLAIT